MDWVINMQGMQAHSQTLLLAKLMPVRVSAGYAGLAGFSARMQECNIDVCVSPELE